MHDLSDLPPEQVELLREYEQRAKERPWMLHLLATCIPKIKPFHESPAEFRLLRGPNGGGKSVSGAAEIVSVATGFHPLRNEKFDTPNITWGVCLDFKNAGRVMRRRLVDMLPRDRNGRQLWKYYKQDSLFVLDRSVGSSEIYMKQQMEGPTSLYAERCAAIWIDEIKPGQMGEDNFSELCSRYTAGRRLQLFITATPEWGADWARRRFDDPTAEEYIRGSQVFEFSLYDCLMENGGFLTEKEVERQSLLCSDEQRQARIFGRWANFIGSPYFSTGLLLKAMKKSEALLPKRAMLKLEGSIWTIAPSESGPLQVRRPKEAGHEYIAAWDPGAGKRKDPHGFVVLDRADLTAVAYCRNDNMDPMWFAATVVVPTASYYNEALLVHEVNGESGGAATEALRDHYSNLYFRRIYDKATSIESDRIGWRTTGAAGHTGGTRGIMLASLDKALREDKWNPAQEILDELGHMVRKPDGKVEHDDGYHDDLAMACAMALCVHYEDPPVTYPNWDRLRIRYREPAFPAYALP